MIDNRTEAGKLLGLPPLVSQGDAEKILGVGVGNLRKVSGMPEPVYHSPKRWRVQDVEMLARARARK